MRKLCQSSEKSFIQKKYGTADSRAKYEDFVKQAAKSNHESINKNF